MKVLSLSLSPLAMAVFVTDKLQHSQSIEQFLKEIEDDFSSPSNSKFQDFIPRSRKNVQAMEEVSCTVCAFLYFS